MDEEDPKDRKQLVYTPSDRTTASSAIRNLTPSRASCCGRRSGRDRTTDGAGGRTKFGAFIVGTPGKPLHWLPHCEFIPNTGVCFVYCDGGLCAGPVRLCAQSRCERLCEGGESSSVSRTRKTAARQTRPAPENDDDRGPHPPGGNDGGHGPHLMHHPDALIFVSSLCDEKGQPRQESLHSLPPPPRWHAGTKEGMRPRVARRRVTRRKHSYNARYFAGEN